MIAHKILKLILVFSFLLPALTGAADTPFIESSNNTSYPAVIYRDRTMHLVWLDDNNIYYSRSDDEGISWSETQELTDSSRNFCYPPSIAMDSSIIHIIWPDYGQNTNGEIKYVRSTDRGLSWDKELILLKDAYETKQLSIEANEENVYIAWQDINRRMHFLKSADHGETWKKPVVIDRKKSDYCFCHPPSLIPDGNKLIYLYCDSGSEKSGMKAWYSGVPLVRSGITKMSSLKYASSEDCGNSWDGNKELIVIKGKDLINFPVLKRYGLNYYLFWVDKRDNKAGELYFIKSTDAGKTWTDESRIIDNEGSPKIPSVIIAGKTIHMAWAEFKDKKSGILYSKGTDGGASWLKQIIAADGSRYHSPSLIMTRSGKLHIFYFEEGKDKSVIYYKSSNDNGKNWITDTYQ
jgi:photosystem II stability/assembly factor-like uncharacterized protein